LTWFPPYPLHQRQGPILQLHSLGIILVQTFFSIYVLAHPSSSYCILGNLSGVLGSPFFLSSCWNAIQIVLQILVLCLRARFNNTKKGSFPVPHIQWCSCQCRSAFCLLAKRFFINLPRLVPFSFWLFWASTPNFIVAVGTGQLVPAWGTLISASLLLSNEAPAGRGVCTGTNFLLEWLVHLRVNGLLTLRLVLFCLRFSGLYYWPKDKLRPLGVLKEPLNL